jgi:hypothetical protein
VFNLLFYAKLRVDNFMIIGNPSYIADYTGNPGSDFSIGEFNDRTSGSAPCTLYCENVRDRLIVNDVSYPKIRTWSKRVALTASMSAVAIDGPSGYWRTCKVKGVSTAGLTSLKLKGTAVGIENASAVVNGSSVYLANVGAMTLAPNTSLAKQIVVSTNGSGAGTLLFEVEYWEDPTAPAQTTYDATGLLS